MVERRKPTPKETKKDIFFPPHLSEKIGTAFYQKSGFLPNPTYIEIEGVRTQVYLAQILPRHYSAGDDVLNLAVLEQFRTNEKGVRSITWRLNSYTGEPITESIAKARNKNQQRILFSRIARKPKQIAGDYIRDKIVDEIDKFKSNK